VRFHSAFRGVFRGHGDGHRPTLRQWFHDYHQRADVEAGIKQGKGVFCLGTFHSRFKAGIQIQEMLVLFACNFLAWLREWLEQRPMNAFLTGKGIKELVRTASNTEATMTINRLSGLLRFDERGPYPGQRLYVSFLPTQPKPPIFVGSQFFNST